MRVGEVIQHSSTCGAEAPLEHVEYMTDRMDEAIGFAAWIAHLRLERLAGPDQHVTLYRSPAYGASRLLTAEEAAQLEVRYLAPEKLRITRTYLALPGPRGECPMKTHTVHTAPRAER